MRLSDTGLIHWCYALDGCQYDGELGTNFPAKYLLK